MEDQKKRVLILDDSEVLLAVARDKFERNGFRVFTALDLNAFEAHLSQEPPDLVVLDVQMPEVFGDDVGTVLREVRGVTAPILLFSGLDEASLSRRAAEAEVDGYVCKSQGVDALVERAEGLLRGARSP